MNAIDKQKKDVENTLLNAEAVLNSERSNLEILPIIFKILDILPFVLALFPDLKERIKVILEAVNKELADFLDSL